MVDLQSLDLRTLQKESGLALTFFLNERKTTLPQLNKAYHHDSQQYYRLVIEEFVKAFGGLPSTILHNRYAKNVSDK